MKVRYNNKLRLAKTEIYFILICLIVFFILLQFSLRAIVIDSDSGYEFTNAQNLLVNGKVTHTNYLFSQFFYGLVMGIFGIDYRNILIIQSILSIIIMLITYKLSKTLNKNIPPFFIPIIFLMFPSFYWGNYTLKQYPLFSVFLLLSVYYLLKAEKTNWKSSKVTIFASIFMVLSVLTHSLPIPFIFLPIFIYIFKIFRIQREEINFNGLFLFYLLFLLFISPYVFWRFLTDGFSIKILISDPKFWGIYKYGLVTNTQFWNLPNPGTIEYYSSVVEVFKNYLLRPVVVFFMLLGVLKVRNKNFLIGWLICLVLPYLLGKAMPSQIYLYIFISFISILVCYGMYIVIKITSSKYVKLLVIATVILSAFVTFGAEYTLFDKYQDFLFPMYEDLTKINEILSPNDRVLCRSKLVAPILPYKEVLQITRDISEEDATIYLGWLSDDEVAEVFKKYNINYVILYKDITWERDYYVWFKIKTGDYPRHYLMIRESKYFKKVYEGRRFILYEFKN